jgi:hypothetical protein
MKGWRKFVWGMTYLLGNMGLEAYALYRGMDSSVIASIAAASVTMAGGLGVVVYGNVQEHKNGGSNGK